MALADTKPSLLLLGETPRLIDEWQMTPVLWDAVRFEVDKRAKTPQFILTGSVVPPKGEVAHIGSGGNSRIRMSPMSPMSLYESKESNGSLSLRDLFQNVQEASGSISDLSIERIAFSICRGGWPASINQPEQVALRMSKDYVEAIINQDISEVDGVERNTERVQVSERFFWPEMLPQLLITAHFKKI